jgi:hypothetical protein
MTVDAGATHCPLNYLPGVPENVARWLAYREQKGARDRFAQMWGVEILTVPTGQGLFIKS